MIRARGAGLDPQDMTLEITETTAMTGYYVAKPMDAAAFLEFAAAHAGQAS